MHGCLELALQGRGFTGINPLVGAVLVRDGKIIAEGFHAEFGKSHAELALLQNFEQKISSEDVLYVNLEPCCHTNKKTPPCVDLIIERGIKHVVYGMQDPNPAVAGKGIALLRSKDIEVTGPILRAECEWLNRGFISSMKNARPWVTLKRAQTMTGDIACKDGSKMKITSKEQDVWSHSLLRATHDAILVGVGTVLSDDPHLNIRFDQNKKRDQVFPFRIVLDENIRILEYSNIRKSTPRVLSDVHRNRTIIVIGKGSDHDAIDQLRATGARVMQCASEEGHFVWSELWNMLMTPEGDFAGINSILVEGGPTTWQAFQKSSQFDAEVTLVGTC